MRNPFVAKTKEEATKDALLKADVRKQMDALKQLGKDILADTRYTKYREDMERLMGGAIKDLLKYNHPDNNIYAVNVRTMVQQLNDLLAFLDAPVKWLNYVEIQRTAIKE